MSDRVIRQIAKEVTFLGAAGAATTTIGALPAGARMISLKALVTVANDAGTSAVIEVGIAGAVAKYEAAIDVKTATGDVATTMLTPVVPTADEVIIATLTEAGTASTAGAATIVIEYIQSEL